VNSSCWSAARRRGRLQWERNRFAGRAPRIGFIQANPGENVAAFMQGLRDTGSIDGQNAIIETRHYVTTPERLDDIARELIVAWWFARARSAICTRCP